MIERVRGKLRDLITVFIRVFFSLVFITFALCCVVAPLVLAEIYGGWCLLLYFISIPLVFAIAELIE